MNQPHTKAITQRVAVKAIIVNGAGHVLLLREASTNPDGTNAGRWHLPGGRVNPGEPFMDALHREVAEETGLQIQPGSPVFVGEWRPVIHGEPHQIVGVFFEAVPLTHDVRLSNEHDAFVWVSPQEVDAYNTMDSEQDAILAIKARMNLRVASRP